MEDPDAQARMRDYAGRRLERLLRAIWQKAIDTDSPEQMAAQQRALAIIDRHAKLFGLDAPTQHVINTPTVNEIDQWIADVRAARGRCTRRATSSARSTPRSCTTATTTRRNWGPDMPFRLNEFRAKVQFITSARMPYLVRQAAKKTGHPSNTVYIQHAVCEALARDLDMDLQDLLDELPEWKKSPIRPAGRSDRGDQPRHVGQV